MIQKSEIRKRYKNKRNSLSKSDVEEKSSQIISRLKQLADFHKKSVHVFLPIQKFNEVNTWPFIEYLFDVDAQVITSQALHHSNELTHFVITPETEYEADQWGIPTPVHSTPVTDVIFDYVLVPLLAFDSRGNRVGYGKGYYDRFLATTSAQKIGVSFFEPMKDDIEVDAFDIPLNYVVTPDKVYRFE